MKRKIRGFILRTFAATLLSFLVLVALSFSGKAARSSSQSKTLGFAERVAYQRAIEEVYWRHRIWPKEAADPKPPLNDVMSQAQLEKKVADYLRKSQALQDYWQRPITAEQLQAEMERMAQHTKQPEVLRELFEALGNNPFVIAECLARPALSERLLTDFYAHDQSIHGELKQRAQADLLSHPAIEQMNSAAYSEIELIKSDSSDIGQERDARTIRLNSREWDESVQNLAGAFNSAEAAKPSGFGLRREVAALQSADMSAHSKNATSDYDSLPVGKLSALQENETCYYAIAVLTKTTDHFKLATVAWPKEPLESWLARAENQRATPILPPAIGYTVPAVAAGCTDDTWTATAGPPDGRFGHTAVWTGTEMIVWGGEVYTGYLNTGARYVLSTDSWTATTDVNAPTGRAGHTAVWTGSEIIIWGGSDDFFGPPLNGINTGGRYNPSTNSWTTTSTTNAPIGRTGHAAVWSGNEMIVWGGRSFNGGIFNTGGRYNPDTNSWSATNRTNAPDARAYHTAVWTGTEMIVWGGESFNGVIFNSGGRYNPATNTWTATNTTNAPSGRYVHTAVWTGNEMIVWGGYDGTNNLNTGGRYNPTTNSWTATGTTNAPRGRYSHTAVWTGTAMIVWGGADGTYANTGGKYNPANNSWTATAVTNAPIGRTSHVAVWTGSEMIVWGGYFSDGNNHYLNSGGRYNPGTNSWTPTNTANTPTGRYRHTGVWTGSEMIVWGGSFFDGSYHYLNTGGKYDASTDSWSATSTTNAPSGRARPTAIWTGTEVIVWGGYAASGTSFNTGGKYNPGTDSWTATSTSDAPTARYLHTAIWTGSEMIIWGGYNYDGNDNFLNTGGRYNPHTNSWTATSTTNAPVGRESHTTVWSGSEMIVWGGDFVDTTTHYLNTGGRYNPVTNSWIATSTTNAPAARDVASAVWTGNEMIFWGGYGDSGYLNSGGRYRPDTNSWRATSTTNAPSPRAGHRGVWTGTEMIIWGGYFYDGNGHSFNTGGRYNPTTNSWIATSTVNVPAARTIHTAVWTGSEMVIWGGQIAATTGTSTGGRYCAPFLGSQLGNISTRAFVQTDDNVMIGGFIVQGAQTKRVIIRAIGPSLTQYGVPNALANTILGLHDGTGALIASNDNWRSTIIGGIIDRNQVPDIMNSGYAPSDGRESAIIADLAPGNYTAIVRGVNRMTGVALVEVYDLSDDASSILGNISTRSFVQTGDNVMIGGFIVQGTEPKRVIVRAIGPELGAPPYNIPNALANPTLELHNATGALIGSNDDWQHTIIGGVITRNQVADIQNSGHAPTDPSESAIIAELPPGNYTAIVRGVNDTTGVGLVEVYDLQ